MDAYKIVEKVLNIFAASQKLSVTKLKRQEDEIRLITQEIYNVLKKEEKEKLDILPSKKTLPRLLINNMSLEQIWQQVELQNSLVLSMATDDLSLKSNLCSNIAELSSQDEENENTDEDDGVETGEESEKEDEKTEERTSDFDEEDVANEEEDHSEVEDDVAEEDEIPDDLSEFSDLDKDTFGDIAVEEDDDDDNENDNDDDNNNIQEPNEPGDSNDEEENSISEPRSNKSFGPSLVDSQFFNLRESEWIADNDLIGKSINDKEDVDFMEDVDSSQSDGEGDGAVHAMYDAFFDPPITKDDEQTQVPSEGNKVKSKFEASVAQETSLQKDLEKETYLTEKPWILKGEVQKKERPENSALEHHLEYNVAIRQKPIITEDTTKKIEHLIISRIRGACWDDVERKVKPTIDPFQFKQKLVLDEEKSKKSLSAIYEEEYLRKQREEQNGMVRTVGSILSESDEKWEELPVHKEIKKEMEDLFLQLDVLSNCHYTPRYKPPEIKVVNNLPAVAIEEATPTTVSDATLLAPQEVVAPLRGELKGETEKEETDKKRERRMKKKHQKARAQREEQKLKRQLKVKDRDGMINKEASVKFVEKAAKQGYVKVLDNEQNSIKSSKGFFDQLQNNVADRTNRKRKRDFKEVGGRKKKNKKPLTMAQLLL